VWLQTYLVRGTSCSWEPTWRQERAEKGNFCAIRVWESYSNIERRWYATICASNGVIRPCARLTYASRYQKLRPVLPAPTALRLMPSPPLSCPHAALYHRSEPFQLPVLSPLIFSSSSSLATYAILCCLQQIYLLIEECVLSWVVSIKP
jgi:hypothetical protein